MQHKTNTKMRILTLLLLCFTSIVFAQNGTKEEFKVLSHKGANTLNGNPLTTGAKLLPADKITVSNGGYIGLLHKTGKTLELRQAGTYVIADLSKKVGSTNTSASKRYSDYVVKELTKGDKEDVNKNYMSHLTVTGSVERGDEAIKLFLPLPTVSPVNLITNSLKINWKKYADNSIYLVKISNNFDETIYSQETTDTTITLDVDKIPLNGETSFICTVALKDKPKEIVSNKRNIKLIKNDKLKEISEDITDLNSNLAEETALNYFVKANFYREKGFFLEAIEYYKKAINADPEAKDFVSAYDDFLNSSGLHNFCLERKK
jgi:tetratricopeptide (TPR) repeat protein